jgi:hypothetical protein
MSILPVTVGRDIMLKTHLAITFILSTLILFTANVQAETWRDRVVFKVNLGGGY